VIAGLRQERFSNDERGIPWLPKIPVLGWLFKNDLTETERRELVVFLSARSWPARARQTSPRRPCRPRGLPAAPGLSAPLAQRPGADDGPRPISATAIPPGAALAAASIGPATPVVVPTPVVTPIAASVSSPAAPPPAPVGPTGDR
jgi:hypothetical protein